MPLVQADAISPEPARDETHERARKIRPEFARGELVRVAGGRNQAEAELIQNMLMEEGVPSILRRTAGFDVPDFLAAGPRDVMVPESGVETARGMLEEADMSPSEPLPPATGRQALVILVVLLGVFGITALLGWLWIHGAI
jgi:hypothetical protein